MTNPPSVLSNLYIIVPVKPFSQAKSRLAPILRKPLRAILARLLLTRTLDTIVASGKGTGKGEGEKWKVDCIVISRDLLALNLAQSKGIVALLESGHDLNSALAEARAWTMQNGADAIMVLPADLPLLTPADIHAMIGPADAPPCAVIAPDRCGHGTNALLLRPPDALHFAFGPYSFDEYCAQAETSNVRLHIYDSPTITFDVDTTEDWEILRARLSAHGVLATRANASRSPQQQGLSAYR